MIKEKKECLNAFQVIAILIAITILISYFVTDDHPRFNPTVFLIFTSFEMGVLVI